ncbi:MAG: hypothetical protein HC905_09690 [Bacteroidales bacterium]|nr:hypothetical protein [Bacteroidales bacterium]
MILLSITVVVVGTININTIRESRYKIVIPKRQSDINHLRIAFVADLHIDKNLKLSFVKQFVRKVNALNPDILLYGGDIIEGHWDENVSAEIIETLKSIKTKYGQYGILGNHEHYGSDNPGRFIPWLTSS